MSRRFALLAFIVLTSWLAGCGEEAPPPPEETTPEVLDAASEAQALEQIERDAARQE